MSKFLQLIEHYMAQLNTEESEESCSSTVRTDRLGNKVKVPHGGTYKQGRNGRAVGVPRGSTSKEDAVGQIHILKPGQELKIDKGGKGQVVCQGKLPKKQPPRNP